MDTSVEFDGVLTPSCTKHLVFSFIKYILYQRGQIPFHFDSLKNYADVPADKIITGISDHNGANGSDADWCHNADGIRHHQRQLRDSLRQERHARRKQRNDEKLRKRVVTFLAAYDQCNQQLSEALDSCSWPSGVQVALLLGGSPISPKEVYVLHFPATEATFDRHPRCLQHRRGARQLFRTLVTCSPLLELTARQLAPTNLHVLVHTTPGGGGGRTPSLVPRPQQAFRRGKVIHIRLHHSAGALSQPVPPPPPAANSPCCGRAAPRRLQPCCAQFAAEMGLALLDASLDTPLDSPMIPAPAGGRRQGGPAASGSEGRSPSTASSRLSEETWSSGSAVTEEMATETARGSQGETGSDGEPEPEPEPMPMWCQIPVVLRGFRTPAWTAQNGGNSWLATTE